MLQLLEKRQYRGRKSGSEFIVAAQVALGAALIIAMIALASLIWRTCRRRAQVQRMPREPAPDTASLNSEQLYVIQRLQDSPPRYDESIYMTPSKPQNTSSQVYHNSSVLEQAPPPYVLRPPLLRPGARAAEENMPSEPPPYEPNSQVLDQGQQQHIQQILSRPGEVQQGLTSSQNSNLVPRQGSTSENVKDVTDEGSKPMGAVGGVTNLSFQSNDSLELHM